MVTKQLVAIEATEPYLAITWQVNNFCNFKCSYCNEGNYNGTHPNLEDPTLYIEKLTEIVDTYRYGGYENFKFFFSGGEPTAWKNLIPICKWIRSYVPTATIAVNTNLSRSLKWWQENFSLFDDVVASFHVEFAKKENYANTSVFLCDKVNYLCNKMLMHEEKFWEVVDFGNYLKTIMPNYFIEWTPLFDQMTVNASPWKYKDAEKQEFFKTHSIDTHISIPKPSKENKCVSWNHYADSTYEPTNSNNIIVNGQNFFKGWQCNVGDAIFIGPLGDLNMASCGQVGTVGHILQDVSRIGPKKVICNKHHCHCGTDIIIPKKQIRRLRASS
jgi:organic radical activating enzyme